MCLKEPDTCILYTLINRNSRLGDASVDNVFVFTEGLAALSFSISSLTLIGMLAAITYTAYGMSALPLNLIKGTRSTAYERLENTEDIEEVEQHIQTIRSKSKDGRPLPARDRRALKQCEERLRTLRKRERHLEFIENSWWTKFCGALRPLKIIGEYFSSSLRCCL